MARPDLYGLLLESGPIVTELSPAALAIVAQRLPGKTFRTCWSEIDQPAEGIKVRRYFIDSPDGALAEISAEEAQLFRPAPLRDRVAELEADLGDWQAFAEWVKEDPLRLAGDGYAEQLFWERRAQLRRKEPTP